MNQSVEVSFNIFHNLPRVFGLGLQEVVNQWIRSTKDFSVESLVRFIRSKDRFLEIYTDKNVPLFMCSNCKSIHIGHVKKCKCGNESFKAITDDLVTHALMAVNLER
jgi:hypothetical protein